MDVAGDVRLVAGRYRLGSVVGRGGMGIVWRARDELLDREVAVKEIVWPAQLGEAERAAARRRALAEARLAARLRHPNVVGIYDIAEDDGRPWIVMELLPYLSLRDILAQDGPLPPAHAAQLGLGILAALRAAHAEGIVHRDVKPGNVIVGPGGRAVLTDFGIARAAGSTALTADHLAGSPSYIAPERAWGGQAGPAADLWGLGAVLYAAVEGRAPFERKDALASLTAAVTDELEPATHAGSLWPAISGLLRKDPGQRLGPAQAEQMLRAVMRGGYARSQWRSRRALGALAATLAVTAAAATAVALPLSESSGRSPAALTAGSRASAPPSPGRASQASTPSGAPASQPPAISLPGAPAAAPSSPAAHGRGAKDGKLPPGQYGFANSADLSISVPHGYAEPGKHWHKTSHVSLADRESGQVADMRHNEFVERVQQQANLSSWGDAERACRATLETLGEWMGGWMPRSLADNIAAQLPPGIGEYLRRTAAHPGGGNGERLGRHDFLPRVAARAGVDNAQAAYIAHAVIDALFAATEGGMMAEVAEILPAELREYVTPGDSRLAPGAWGQAPG